MITDDKNVEKVDFLLAWAASTRKNYRPDHKWTVQKRTDLYYVNRDTMQPYRYCNLLGDPFDAFNMILDKQLFVKSYGQLIAVLNQEGRIQSNKNGVKGRQSIEKILWYRILRLKGHITIANLSTKANLLVQSGKELHTITTRTKALKTWNFSRDSVGTAAKFMYACACQFVRLQIGSIRS